MEKRAIAFCRFAGNKEALSLVEYVSRNDDIINTVQKVRKYARSMLYDMMYDYICNLNYPDYLPHNIYNKYDHYIGEDNIKIMLENLTKYVCFKTGIEYHL